MKFLLIYVPNLRFSNLDKLMKVRLGDICTITGGYAFDSHKMTQKGDYQIIKMGNLYNGIFDLSRNSSFINAPTKKELEYLIQENDILITLTGTTNKKDYGYTVQMEQPKNLLLNQRCALIRASKVNEKYLFYLLNSNDFLKQFYASSTGGTGNQTNVSINDMLDFKVYISNENDQSKISNFLNALDKKILTQIKIINDCMSYRNAIVDYFFESLSSDWKQVRLSNILNEYSELHVKDNSIVHATLSKNGIFPKTDRYDRDFLVKDEDKKYKVTHLDDICYNPANLKFGVITRNTFGDCIISPIYITFTIKNNCLPKFVELLVTRKHFIAKARKYEQGTVYERMSVNSSDLLSMYVLIPTLFIQQKIVNIIDIIDNKISNEQKLLNLYKTQKDYLLKNMFV